MHYWLVLEFVEVSDIIYMFYSVFPSFISTEIDISIDISLKYRLPMYTPKSKLTLLILPKFFLCSKTTAWDQRDYSLLYWLEDCNLSLSRLYLDFCSLIIIFVPANRSCFLHVPSNLMMCLHVNQRTLPA